MLSLDPFQLEVIEFFNRNGGRGIYADPVGARKTGTTLSWLADNPDLTRILLVAPKSVHGHWKREAGKFYPKLNAYGSGGMSKPRRAEALECVAVRPRVDPAVYVTTYESMKADEDQLKAAKFNCVVFDEGHRLKGRRTDVALTANAITKDPECVLIVTGTPVMTHADEMWQYLHMLDRKTYTSFDRWVRTHFDVDDTDFHGKAPRKIRVVGDIKAGHEPVLRAQLKGVMIQREIGTLFPGEAWVQPPEHVVIDIDLSPAERKAYDKMVKHCWIKVKDEVITVENKLAQTTRLRQLCSDWTTLDPSAEDGAKVVAALELIRDLARRETVVAFTAYKTTAQRLVRRLQEKGLEARPWTGDESKEEHEAVLRDYEAGLVDVVVGTIDSLGEGVDGFQHRGSSIVMLDRDWTPGINDQCVGRRRRSGQREQVTIYHVMARNTLDVGIVSSCMHKQNFVEILADRPLIDTLYGVGFQL